MVPAGRTYLLLPKSQEGEKETTTAVSMWKVASPEFGLISVANSMFFDHMPDKYESALKAVLETVKQDFAV